MSTSISEASSPSTSSQGGLLRGLPDSARLWAFGVSRPLASGEERRFLEAVDAFLATWKAHGDPLAATREWVEGRFLLVGVDERIAAPSGCSIDALVRILQLFESELGVEMVGGGSIWYRDAAGGGPLRSSRSEFREKARQGEVGPETIVFDLALTRVGELREGKWEGPAARSWHRRYFS